MISEMKTYCLLICILLAGIAGCGDGRPDVFPASGRMLFEGQPMPLGASVTFLPIEGGSGVATSGMVDAEGNLEITTFENQSGLAAGKYRVVVYQLMDKEPDEVGEDGEIRPAADASFVVVSEDQTIPEIYSDRARSPLQVTIEAGANDLGTIELKANPEL